MGIFDFIKKFKQKQDNEGNAKKALANVKKAAEQADYNQASIEAFYAVATLGHLFKGVVREESITAREYSKLLEEEGIIEEGYLQPLVLNFELAKYSPETLTLDQFTASEELLQTFELRVKDKKIKAPKGKKPAGKSRGKKKPASRAASRKKPQKKKRRAS
jgi:hypothetical protein